MIITLVLLAVFAIYEPLTAKKFVEQRFNEFEDRCDDKKAAGHNVTEAETFTRQAKQAYDIRDYNKANKLLDNASEALKKSRISSGTYEAVKKEAKKRLSRVKVASVYQRVTDGKGGRSIDDVIKLLKETKTDFIFRGWWRWVPCPESPETTSEEVFLDLGYTYKHLKEAVNKIKTEMPDVVFCGAIPAQRINARERNPITDVTFGEEETWAMATDPAKWGIDISKVGFQETLGEYTGSDRDAAYFPDITNPKFQELLLSWAKKQIDYGADAIWIDSLFSQAIIFEAITKDPNHPAVKDSFEAASKIVDDIHDYGHSKDKYILVGTWSGFVELPHPHPNLDFVTVTPTGKEILDKNLDEIKWDGAIAKIRGKTGDTPIFAFIDWTVGDDAPLATFSQKLSKEDQREMLLIMDEFFQRKGVIFMYPLHGGWMGKNVKSLSFGKYDTYDSMAPEFETGETIKSFAQSRSSETK